MASPVCHRTLYEDWQLRRDRQLLPSSGNNVYRQIQWRVLDYLLRRYYNAPEARRTVAFPFIADLSSNDRALAVRRCLAERGGPTITSSEEAHLRVKSVLERMYSTDPSEPQLASSPVEHPTSERDIHQVYLRLCHPEGLQRVLAAVELGERGSLEDIGLLCDLLALPSHAEEHPCERTALSHSLARLAGVTSTSFDLTDAIPPPPQADNAEEINGIDDWICRKCQESVPANFEVCWSCGTTIDGMEDPAFLATFRVDEDDSNETPPP
jgi:hypothetical protein